jgi:hypothetical protein
VKGPQADRADVRIDTVPQVDHHRLLLGRLSRVPHRLTPVALSENVATAESVDINQTGRQRLVRLVRPAARSVIDSPQVSTCGDAGPQTFCGNPRLIPPWLGSSQRWVTTLPLVKKCTPSVPWAWLSPNRDAFHPPKE